MCNMLPSSQFDEVICHFTALFCAVQLEKDVKEALFAIAKQKGKIDPNVSHFYFIRTF